MTWASLSKKRWEIAVHYGDARRPYVFSQYRFKFIARFSAFVFDLANGPSPFAIVRRIRDKT